MTDHRRYTKRRLQRELAYAKGRYESLLWVEREFDMSAELEEEIDKFKDKVEDLERRIKNCPADPVDDEN